MSKDSPASPVAVAAGPEPSSTRTEPESVAMIQLQGAAKTYAVGRRTVEAVRGVSLQIEGGEFVAIVGPSGSGKSTLMHLIGALDTPSAGSVVLFGQDLARLTDRERSLLRRTRIGFVFQAFNLLPTLTAAENVALPLLLGHTRRAEALKRAAVCLDRVGLGPRAGHFPDELSGGEMQRTAVARALVTEPDVVLCDEPTGNLDSQNSRDVLALLSQLPYPGKRAVVMVTHDPAAAAAASRVVSIRDGWVESDRFTSATQDAS